MTGQAPAADEGAALDVLLERLNDRAVRDLAWLLLSSPLLRERSAPAELAHPFESERERAAVEAWLLALDRDPLGLHCVLAAAPITRLGRYAECLLGYFLAHGPGSRLVAANVALRRAGRTLGECDFLVRTASGRRLHWELAVKCYLHEPGDAPPSLADYVGPNRGDRFDVKLARLVDHQLTLSAREEFASLGFAGPWRAQMFVKGWLFYPQGHGAYEPRALPDAVEPGHARGFWVPHGAWMHFAAQAAERWCLLPRLAWLAPLAPAAPSSVQAATLAGAAAMAEHAVQHHGPTMVAGFAPDPLTGAWRERARGFIVPDAWSTRPHPPGGAMR